MNTSISRFDRLVPVALLLVVVGLLGASAYRNVINDDALEKMEKYQLQQIQIEQDRLRIERAEFVRECIDDGGRTPEDCLQFLNGTYSKSSLYAGC